MTRSSPFLTRPAPTAQSCLPSQPHQASQVRRPCPPSLQTRPAKPPNQACDPARRPRSAPPSRPAMPANQASHARRPGPLRPPTWPAKPADPPSRPNQPGQSPLLWPRCRRPSQPRIVQLPAHQRQLAHFPLMLSKNVAISGDPSKNIAIARVRICAPLHAHRRRL